MLVVNVRKNCVFVFRNVPEKKKKHSRVYLHGHGKHFTRFANKREKSVHSCRDYIVSVDVSFFDLFSLSLLSLIR